MKDFVLIYTALLFFVLAPGVLFTLPKNNNKYTIAMVHSLLFGTVFYFTNNWFYVNKNTGFLKEGLSPDCPKGASCKDSKHCNAKNIGKKCSIYAPCPAKPNKKYLSACGTCNKGTDNKPTCS